MTYEQIVEQTQDQFKTFFAEYENRPACGSLRHRDWVRMFVVGAFSMQNPYVSKVVSDHLERLSLKICEDDGWLPNADWWA